MALFDFFKKTPQPYQQDATNQVYELLFCDQLDRYQKQQTPPYPAPWDILFAKTPDTAALQRLVAAPDTESRVKLLAYHRLRAAGQPATQKELLGVIVEVGLDDGLDVLAAYRDGTARYLNQSGKMIIWETTTPQSDALIERLFQESIQVVQQIGPWLEARRPHPAKNTVRLSFLVSDGLYFGEGGLDVLFADPLAKPTLNVATALMQYLTGQVLDAPGT